MSSNGFLLSLDIDRRACLRVPALVIGCTLLALAAISLSGLAVPGRALAAALTLACGLREFGRVWPGSTGYVSRIHVSAEGRFHLGRAGEPDTLASATLVRRWLLPGFAVGLVFIGEGGQRSEALLFRDLLPPDVWRRLQVRLRHASHPVSGLVSGPVSG
jgi:hypothetical protein